LSVQANDFNPISGRVADRSVVVLQMKSTPRSRWLALVGVILGAAALEQVSAADDAKQKRYGQHLAQECTACHRVDGVANGIPSIAGWDVETFVATMQFYKTGARTNPVMVSVVGSLDDEQIAALAAYYGSLPKPGRANGKAAPR
jgi:cytochrome c553